ncbi:MAG: hypothetical protein OEY22_10440 [Candidatus Bathyarchaeota archaeon]|nr:hypothetical protein [Candidatus Bathyarchaeota archaeon]
MKGKFLLLLVIIVAAALTSAPLVQAFPDVNVFAYTDKTEYKPGGTVTLHLWVHNAGPEDIILKNVTIEYPWYSPMWDGNNTIIVPEANSAVLAGKNWTGTDTFTIPTDGRAHSGEIRIRAWYAYGGGTYPKGPDDSIYLSVISSTQYTLSENMDKIVNLFTILVVLIIICTIIIAATMFLSGRKPQVTWAREQKTE